MFAAIDVGSNTLRLLVGKIADDRVIPDFYLRRICRLAGGLTEEEGLSSEARARTLFSLQEFAGSCQQAGVCKIRAVGTAAFRQALNGRNFASEIISATKLPFEIITGEQEARLMAVGVLSALCPVPKLALIIDIGGGSTEFVLCEGQAVVRSWSLPLGVVRLTESCPATESRLKVIDDEIASLVEGLSALCRSRGASLAELQLVGTAGTITTLAALEMQMTAYDWRRVNNYSLSMLQLRRWQSVLAPMTTVEREELPGMEEGRGDLIPAGLELICSIMTHTGAELLAVSDFGILEGILLSLESSPDR